jgi:hypothetical protein
MCETGTDLLPANAVEVVRKMRGGSQSALVRCDDNQLYVVKLKGNPQGDAVLGNELLAARLLRGVGLPTPAFKPVFLSKAFVDSNCSLDFETSCGTRSTSAGLHFGSHFLAQDDRSELFSILPRSHHSMIENRADLLGAYIFDIWANHRDDRQFVFRRQRDARVISAFMVDNGHMFGGPSWDETHRPGLAMCCDKRLYEENFNADTIEKWCSHFENVLPHILHNALSGVPEEWYKHDRTAALTDFLEDRLGHVYRLFMVELSHNPRVRGHYRTVHNDKMLIHIAGVSPLRDTIERSSDAATSQDHG